MLLNLLSLGFVATVLNLDEIKIFNMRFVETTTRVAFNLPGTIS